jgi:glycosyltransferase involved in cell wall biosynthesis
MKRGWLVNDTLTCIPNTKTFWHDLLDWIPGLEDKCGGNTPFSLLPYKIEKDCYDLGIPDYIIRNATYFRKLNVSVKTISLLQDISSNKMEQLDVCNNSDIVVFNSPYTRSHYESLITTKTVMIPLGVDFDLFKNLNKSFVDELGILTKSILYIGADNHTPKGFDIMMDIINNTDYNFCLVMKDDFNIIHERVKVFNKVDHNLLLKIINSCDILVCTSRIETLHLAGVEAAACGLPLVTSNVGIYYNKPSGEWGRNTNSFNYQDFIREIEYVKNHRDEFNPRKEFLDMGLSTESCKSQWINLINQL